MLSDFDKQNLPALLLNEGNRFDWFSAVLLRFLYQAPQNLFSKDWKKAYPEHCDLVEQYLDTTDFDDRIDTGILGGRSYDDALRQLYEKADLQNTALLEQCSPISLSSFGIFSF